VHATTHVARGKRQGHVVSDSGGSANTHATGLEFHMLLPVPFQFKAAK